MVVVRDRLSGRWPGIVAALFSLAAAAVVFSRVGIDTTLSRDEAIYTYAGQQLADGVLPYTSIFDPKTPLASLMAGAAAAFAGLIDRNDLYAIRAAYFVCACLTALAMYLLAATLWRSALAGLTAALVFVSFRIFAVDALGGPNAKTPAILLSVLTMWLLVRRQWFWAGTAGALAFLTWQPMVFFPTVVVVLAFVQSTGERVRRTVSAVVGAVLPVLLTAAIFAMGGSFHDLLESTLQFPLQGVHRSPETIPERMVRIVDVVGRYSGFSEPQFWLGLALFVALALVWFLIPRVAVREAIGLPLVTVLLTTLLLQLAYAATDFQSYPDLYPFLPYAALGIAGVVGVVVQLLRSRASRTTAGVVTVVALGSLVLSSVLGLRGDVMDDQGLRAQMANGCALERLQTADAGVYAMGDATPLVVTRSRNPDRFIYLASGVDHWKVAHQDGGFDGWVEEILNAEPAVVVISGWAGRLRDAMGTRLREAGYRPRHVGAWFVLVPQATIDRARASGVRLRVQPTPAAIDPAGRTLAPWPCR
jgi:hypothetical protein